MKPSQKIHRLQSFLYSGSGLLLVLLGAAAVLRYAYQIREIQPSYWPSGDLQFDYALATHIYLLEGLVAGVAAIGLLRKDRWVLVLAGAWAILALGRELLNTLVYGLNTRLMSEMAGYGNLYLALQWMQGLAVLGIFGLLALTAVRARTRRWRWGLAGTVVMGALLLLDYHFCLRVWVPAAFDVGW